MWVCCNCDEIFFDVFKAHRHYTDTLEKVYRTTSDGNVYGNGHLISTPDILVLMGRNNVGR